MPEDYTSEEAEYDAAKGEACSVDEENSQDLPEFQLKGSEKASNDEEEERVQEDIAGRIDNWRGVRSCNDSERAKVAALPHAQAWVNATIAANPGRTVVNAAYYGSWSYRNETTSSGRRICTGWWTSCVVYVDFA